MTRIGIVGLGYAGLPLALAFAHDGIPVTGYDIDEERVETLRRGDDPLGEGLETKTPCITYTAAPRRLSACDVVFVTVPTPVTAGGDPDTSALRSAGRTIGANLRRGALVALRSTVYPGGTHGEFVPCVERASGWTAGEEFGVGYAPERMSPGDDAHAFSTIAKVVAAEDETHRQTLVDLFERVVEGPVLSVSSIEACEAAKCLENVQRDVNIALMNEFAMACDRLPEVDPGTAIEAAETKWNFHSYRPGMVDGHCVPVDPQYLAHRFEEAGHSPTLIRTAREVNDRVATHVAELVSEAVSRRSGVATATTDGGSVVDGDATDRRGRVLAMGLAYKPDVADLRAPTTGKAIAELGNRGFDVVGYDPHVDPDAAAARFDIPVRESLDATGFDAVVVFTGHSAFGDLDVGRLAGAMNDRPALIDVSGTVDESAARDHGFTYRGF